MATSTRYTVLLDPAAVKSLERLAKTYNLKTKAEVYDLAVRVLTWTTDQLVNGKEVGRFSNGEFQPLLLPYDLNRRAWQEDQQESPLPASVNASGRPAAAFS